MPGVERLSVREAAKAAVQPGPRHPPSPSSPHRRTQEERRGPRRVIRRPDRQRGQGDEGRGPRGRILCDVALDPFTDHGHDGLIENGRILNDRPLSG